MQRDLHGRRENLLEKGILYPLAFQWKDHAHHDFALAFLQNSCGPYRTSMTPPSAIDALETELKETGATSVIISSELSPIYFKNPRFAQFARSRFDEVELLFTVRWQSELLLSLFSQLIADKNVRYSQTIFYLFLQNIHWLDFSARIHEWEKFVHARNISVFAHSQMLLDSVAAHFGLPPLSNDSTTSRVNSSIPSRSLLAIQKLCAGLTNPTDYIKKRDAVLIALTKSNHSGDALPLFTGIEQAALDKSYLSRNKILSERYRFFGQHLNELQQRKDILCASPDDVIKINPDLNSSTKNPSLHS